MYRDGYSRMIDEQNRVFYDAVDDFIAGFKSDENLRFAGMKDFNSCFGHKKNAYFV